MPRLSLLFTLLLLPACAPPAAVPPHASPDDAAKAYRESRVIRRVTPPKLSLPTVPVRGERALGSDGAKVAIVEFGDYECPYCRGFHFDTLPRIKSAYIDTGKVRYFYKDFPLPTHQHAFSAGIAAYCAGAQGRYWQMQDLLYAEQTRLGDALYNELAAHLKLDPARFSACRRSRAAYIAVRRDFEDGRRLGVNATPSFALGRVEGDHVIVQRVAAGAPAFDTFARELDALNH